MLHRNAKRGSGGVCFLIKDSVYKFFDVTLLDCSKEDILWIKLQEKGSTLCFCLCVCYLPPKGSSRRCDPETFFADLLYQVYMYQNEGTVCISGDFNSRIGYNTDFIEGVDRIPSREVIDKTENHYGDLFVDFLVDSNFCVLNGRIGNENNYTCVSKKGKSVVDYVMVPHESIPSVSDFKVNMISDLIDRYNMDVPDKTPDHSILEWKLAVMNKRPNDEPAFETQFKGNKRYDTSRLTTEFLNSEDCESAKLSTALKMNFHQIDVSTKHMVPSLTF